MVENPVKNMAENTVKLSSPIFYGYLSQCHSIDNSTSA